MSGSDEATTPRRVEFNRTLARRFQEPSFWIIQAAVVLIASLHMGVEARGYPNGVWRGIEGSHHLPVVLYLGPVAYGALSYGWEGGVLTGLWTSVLSLPNLIIWHSHDYEWTLEVSFVVVVAAMGVIISLPVEGERRERRRAEAAADEIAVLLQHEQTMMSTYVKLVTEAQEEERRRLARELHDGPTQHLTVLLRRLEGSSSSSSDSDELREHATVILNDLRRVARDQRPAMLDDLGLVPALEWLVSELRDRTDLEVVLEVTGRERRLAPETEVACYRIAQEAMRNAEAHASPTRIGLAIDFKDAGISLTITDDGQGFDAPESPGEYLTRGRLGLMGMYERASLVGASLEIRSSADHGTTVLVRCEESDAPVH
ncbi:MAG: sensor histidine kinase [Acidimicrobiales bacterium]